MAKTKNLTFSRAMLVGIHKVEQHDPNLYHACGADWDRICDVHFTGETLRNSRDLCNPHTSVGLVVEMKAASAVERPTCSQALYFEDEIYWFASWSDIFGRSGSKAPCCRRNGRLIKFVYKCTNPYHRQMMLDLISEKGYL